MENSEVLLTAAEIGATIAGFSSLATLLGRSVSLDAYRFEGMLINSLLVIAFALLPFLIDALFPTNEYLWRVASGILLLSFGSRGFLVTYRTLGYKKAGATIGKPFYIMTALLVIVCIALTLSVLDLFPNLTAGLYLIGLFGVLANACVLFLLVFLTVIHQMREENKI